MATKSPAFQFYPGDWQRDAALRACSVGARGCWIEMICIMHQAEPYGHLRVNGKPIVVDTLARMIGATSREVKGWMQELSDAGVYATDEDGGIYSKRMVKDEAIRKARAEGGKKGGNPALLGSQKVRAKDNLRDNLEPTPSSSSSSSSSTSVNTHKHKRADFLETHLSNPGFADVWDLWGRHLLELGKPLTATSSEAQLFKLADFDVEEAIEMVRYSIAQGAKNLITNGDHNRTESVRGPRIRSRVPSFEEGILRD